MAAVSLRLPEDLKVRLEKLSKLTGRSKTYYMAGRSVSFSQSEIEKRYGLED